MRYPGSGGLTAPARAKREQVRRQAADWFEQGVAGRRVHSNPIDAAGSIALACLSTAAGGRAEIEVRGSWREPTNLFTVVVLPPGSRKSAVFAAMVGPILVAEKALIERTAPAIIEAELSAKVAGKAAEKAALAAANADASGRDTLIAEATAAAMSAEAVTIPVEPQLVADDVTSETAQATLHANLHALVLALAKWTDPAVLVLPRTPTMPSWTSNGR